VDVNLCKIQKIINFTHFVPKIFHIGLKIVYIYTFVTITVYIYIVIIVLQINILFYFLSHRSKLSLLPHFSLSLSLSLSKEHNQSPIHPPPQPNTTPLPSLQHIIIQPKNQWKIKPKIKRKLNPKSIKNKTKTHAEAAVTGAMEAWVEYSLLP